MAKYKVDFRKFKGMSAFFIFVFYSFYRLDDKWYLKLCLLLFIFIEKMQVVDYNMKYKLCNTYVILCICNTIMKKECVIQEGW